MYSLSDQTMSLRLNSIVMSSQVPKSITYRPWAGITGLYAYRSRSGSFGLQVAKVRGNPLLRTNLGVLQNNCNTPNNMTFLNNMALSCQRSCQKSASFLTAGSFPSPSGPCSPPHQRGLKSVPDIRQRCGPPHYPRRRLSRTGRAVRCNHRQQNSQADWFYMLCPR